jgi:ParB family chromosome partitioning protein
MDFGFLTVGEIDWGDVTFEIGRFSGRDRLRDSLERFGILDPPWIWKRQGRNIVVDGFKRLRWAVEKGIGGTVCRIFPDDISSGDLWERRIEKKLLESDINVAEKARIVSALLELYPSGKVPSIFLSALNLSPRPELLQSWAGLAREEPEVQEMLASGDIGERAALETAGWDRESRAAVFEVLRALRCSVSIQLEIIERIDEIAIREDKAGAEIIRDAEFQSILSDRGMNHRRKTQAVRDLLGRLRFPVMRAREQRFLQSVEALCLPSAIRIVPPPAFEGNDWRMELSFSSAGGLRDLLRAAADAAASGRLGGVLEREKRRADTAAPGSGPGQPRIKAFRGDGKAGPEPTV